MNAQVVHAMDKLGRPADKMRIKKVLEEFYRWGSLQMLHIYPCIDSSHYTSSCGLHTHGLHCCTVAETAVPCSLDSAAGCNAMHV